MANKRVGKQELSTLGGGSTARGIAIRHLRSREIALTEKTVTEVGVIREGGGVLTPRPRQNRHPRGVGTLTLESGRLKTPGSSVLPTMILCSLPRPWPPAPSARAALAPCRSPATRSLVVFPMAAVRVGGHLPRGAAPGEERRVRSTSGPAPPPGDPVKGIPAAGKPSPASLPSWASRNARDPPTPSLSAAQETRFRELPCIPALTPAPRSPPAMRSLLPGRRRAGCSKDKASNKVIEIEAAPRERPGFPPKMDTRPAVRATFPAATPHCAPARRPL